MPRADAAHERLAIAAIENLKGTATLDKSLNAEARVAAKFETLTDAGLAKLCKYPQIGAIDIADSTRCTERATVKSPGTIVPGLLAYWGAVLPTGCFGGWKKSNNNTEPTSAAIIET